MARRVLHLPTILALITAIVLVAGYGSIRPSASPLAAPGAQQASPIASPVGNAIDDVAQGLPDEVTVELLASAEAPGLPSAGASLRLQRLTLLSNEYFAETTNAISLIAVEGGSVSI